MTGVVAVALALAGALPASAAGNDEGGLWYYNDYAVADAVAAGASGAGVKVAVLDTLLNTDLPYLAGADITVHEPSYCASLDDANTAVPATSTDFASSQHGTGMVSLIVGNGEGPGGVDGPLGVAPDASILYYATGYSQDSGLDSTDLDTFGCPAMGVEGDTGAKGDAIAFASSIDQAVADGADIIAIASNTSTTTDAMYDAVARAVRAGVVIVAARSNFPDVETDTNIAGMNGVVTVQSMDPAGNLQEASNIADPATDVVGPGVAILGSDHDFDTLELTTGNSNATNIVAGYLADVKSKYPAATGNQLIQTLVRNTGTDEHELAKDPTNFVGYGLVSLRHMLEVDPTTYDDVNPLVTDDDSTYPHYEDIYGSAASGSDPSDSAPTGSASAEPQGASGPLGALVPVLLVGGIVLLLVLIGVVVLVIVLVRRSRRATPPREDTP